MEEEIQRTGSNSGASSGRRSPSSVATAVWIGKVEATVWMGNMAAVWTGNPIEWQCFVVCGGREAHFEVSVQRAPYRLIGIFAINQLSGR